LTEKAPYKSAANFATPRARPFEWDESRCQRRGSANGILVRAARHDQPHAFEHQRHQWLGRGQGSGPSRGCGSCASSGSAARDDPEALGVAALTFGYFSCAYPPGSSTDWWIRSSGTLSIGRRKIEPANLTRRSKICRKFSLVQPAAFHGAPSNVGHWVEAVRRPRSEWPLLARGLPLTENCNSATPYAATGISQVIPSATLQRCNTSFTH
jgi:hypothetical protein